MQIDFFLKYTNEHIYEIFKTEQHLHNNETFKEKQEEFKKWENSEASVNSALLLIWDSVEVFESLK